MSQPPGPDNPYGGQQPYGSPQQPYNPPPPSGYPSYPQQPAGVPPQGGYPGHPGYGYPAQQGYPGQGYPGYPGPQMGGPLPGMPPLASWGARVGALLLDMLIVNLVPMGLLFAGYIQLVVKVAHHQDACDQAGTIDCGAPHIPPAAIGMIIIGGLLSLVGALYLTYREGSTGQTPGKKIVGIRLLREYDGSTLGFGLAFGRRLLHFIDGAACYLGYLWPLWDDKRQTFTDKIVHTVVIKDPR